MALLMNPYPFLNAGTPRPFPPSSSPRGGQRGISLFISLVTLVIITLAGIALLRSVDTGALVAGNLAFKDATMQATSVGMEEAATYLNNTVRTVPNANLPANCAAAVSSSNLGDCRYYARVQPEDTDGAPFINWASANIPVTTVNASYQVQHVIERLCTADMSIPVALPVPATMDRAADRCHTTTADPGGSKKGGGTIQPDMPVATMYRVTTRVTGPRNATSITQTILAL
jgi:type IV pilus assembly protein PilX